MNKKVEEIIETLRTAQAEEVYEAFTYAPNDNLIAMKNMIAHILKDETRVN